MEKIIIKVHHIETVHIFKANVNELTLSVFRNIYLIELWTCVNIDENTNIDKIILYCVCVRMFDKAQNGGTIHR